VGGDLAMNHRQGVNESVIEVLSGLTISTAISVSMFLVVILGPFWSDVYSGSPLLWSALFYSPSLTTGLIAIVTNRRVVGRTLIIAGVFATMVFYGLVYGLYGSF
jgi:F0F1-type ATP synthase membrane subunit c/vacuolar-type H+-ATPase subunit K